MKIKIIRRFFFHSYYYASNERHPRQGKKNLIDELCIYIQHLLTFICWAVQNKNIIIYGYIHYVCDELWLCAHAMYTLGWSLNEDTGDTLGLK